jgi:hypothetical protein
VDEGVHIAELQFDGGANIVIAGDCAKFPDDAQAAVHVPPVIIGQFKNEKIFKNISIDHGISVFIVYILYQSVWFGLFSHEKAITPPTEE